MSNDKFDLFLELLIETRKYHGDNEVTLTKLIELCKKVNQRIVLKATNQKEVIE